MWEGYPLFSPDGTHIAYLYSEGDPQVSITQLYVTTPAGGIGVAGDGKLDRPIANYVWSRDSKSLVVDGSGPHDERARCGFRCKARCQRIDAGDVVPGTPLSTTGGAAAPSLGNALAADGTLVFLASATAQPPELYKSAPDGRTTKVTDVQRRARAARMGGGRTNHIPDNRNRRNRRRSSLSAAGLFCRTGSIRSSRSFTAVRTIRRCSSSTSGRK